MPHSRTIVVEPRGEFATVDTTLARDALSALLGDDPGARRQVARLVEGEPERFAPVVLYALSEVLLELGRTEDACFWFFAGQVRARFDAERCTDPTAAAAVSALDARFGPAVDQVAFADLDRLRRVVIRAVAWDRATPHRYDHRWIALHGMRAHLGTDEPLSVPEAQWPALAARTRARHLARLRQVLAERRG